MKTNRALLQRQGRRYHTGPEDHYHHSNKRISAYLDGIKPRLSGRKIADIGAGEIPFKEYYEDLSVTYCDIKQNQTGTIDVLLPEEGGFPLGDSEFGGLFLFDVMEHVKNDILFVKECHRILAPGGLIVATVPFLYRFHEEPHDYRRYTPSGLRYILGDVGGFVKVDVLPYGNPATICKIVLLESGLKRPDGLKHRIVFKALKTFLDLASGPEGLYGDRLSETTASGYFVIAEKA